MTYANKDPANKQCYYDGEWRDGMKHGHGKETYASGDRYEGEFRNDKRHGRGTYTYTNKYRDSKTYSYEGQFRDSLFNGLGKRILLADGTVYYWGQYENGQPCGPNLKDYAECTVCMERPATHACVPCGHQCLCDARGDLPCHQALTVNGCPMCKRRPTGYPIRIYAGSEEVKCHHEYAVLAAIRIAKLTLPDGIPELIASFLETCEENATHACIPCGHQCVCEEHAKGLKQCLEPGCDHVVDSMMRIFK